MATDFKIYSVLSIISAILVLAVIGWQYPVTTVLSELALNDQYWPIVVFVLFILYIVRPFFLWPLSVSSVFIGYVFGFPYGLPLVLAGTVITCFPPFLIAERFNGEFGYFDRLSEKGTSVVNKTGALRGMIAARLSPAPADAISYGAGMTGISSQTFAIGTLIGELPWAVFYILLGESLRTFSATAIDQTDIRFVLLTALGSILLVAYPLYEYLYTGTAGDEKLV